MQSSYKSAREVDDGLAWSNERYGFAYWKAEPAQECELENTSAIPTEALYTSKWLPTSALIEIIYRSDELLRLALDYAINEADYERDYEPESEWPERIRERYREYRNGPPLRLRSVDTDSVIGFAYTATFGSENAIEGPGVTFSLTADGFLIHSVGEWIV
jgi:hypothetical protein